MRKLIKLMHFAPFLFEQGLFINQTESKLALPLWSICKENGLWEAGCAGTGREVFMHGVGGGNTGDLTLINNSCIN